MSFLDHQCLHHVESPGFLAEGGSGPTWLHPLVGCSEASPEAAGLLWRRAPGEQFHGQHSEQLESLFGNHFLFLSSKRVNLQEIVLLIPSFSPRISGEDLGALWRKPLLSSHSVQWLTSRSNLSIATFHSSLIQFLFVSSAKSTNSSNSEILASLLDVSYSVNEHVRRLSAFCVHQMGKNSSTKHVSIATKHLNNCALPSSGAVLLSVTSPNKTRYILVVVKRAVFSIPSLHSLSGTTLTSLVVNTQLYAFGKGQAGKWFLLGNHWLLIHLAGMRKSETWSTKLQN